MCKTSSAEEEQLRADSDGDVARASLINDCFGLLSHSHLLCNVVGLDLRVFQSLPCRVKMKAVRMSRKTIEHSDAHQ
jgi:hypothetical protein